MFVKITSKRQVTFPARVLDALGVKPGDRLELSEGPEGYVLRARTIDLTRLAPLRGKLRRGKGAFDLAAFRDKPRRGKGAFDLAAFRDKPHGRSVRD